MRVVFTILFCLLSAFSYAQEQDFSVQFNNRPLKEVLLQIEEQFEVKLFFDETVIDQQFYTGTLRGASLSEVLNTLLANRELFSVVRMDKVYITNRPILTNDLPLVLNLGANDTSTAIVVQDKIKTDVIFERDYKKVSNRVVDSTEVVTEIGSLARYVKGATSTLAGRVINSTTKQPLEGVFIYDNIRNSTAVTDANGAYSINLVNGQNEVRYQFVGRQTVVKKLMIFSEGELTVEMAEDVFSLDEVIVEGDAVAEVQRVEMGIETLDLEEIKQIPVILGERDILKVATTLPGINTFGEGATGFYVRGGKSDQNLFLFDGGTVYNVSHFLGFFSVFNSDALDGMDVYKGGVPARFGGRLSSVFEINSKNPSKTDFSIEGGISPIASRLTLDIPIVKGKSALLVSGRTTYSDLVLDVVDNPEFSQNKVDFSDAIVKYQHTINENNNLSFSFYRSKDNFQLSSDTLFTFSNFSNSNTVLSANWNHRFNERFDGKLSFTQSYYDYELNSIEVPASAFVQDFDITESTIKSDFYLEQSEKHLFNFGTEVKRYAINPGSQLPFGNDSEVSALTLTEEVGLEGALFFSDEYKFSDKMSFNVGGRLSAFQLRGPGTSYDYAEGLPKSVNTRIDSTVYARGEPIQTYGGPELRIGMRYLLNESSSIKFGYGKGRQYIHTLMNTASVSPTDVWRLSNRHIKPQISDEISVGYFKTFAPANIEASVEVYGKVMQNLLDFKTGANFLLNENIETAVIQGDGRAYGVEFSIKKSGRLNGWLNYAYARSFIQLDGKGQDETINEGQFFPTNFDMPHVLNLVSNYEITQRLIFSFNFTYNSGRPLTVPTGVYNFQGVDVINFSERNSERIRDYVRLDVGLTLKWGYRREKFSKSYWSLSFYNVLGRDNPFSVFFDVENGDVKAYQLTVFENMIPTISYNFKL